MFSVSPQYVFSHQYIKASRASVSISVFDSAGNPVAANTPVAIFTSASRALFDTLFSNQLFKVEYNPSYGNIYYFITDQAGRISAGYGAGNYISPNDSLPVFVSAYAVRFATPGDSASASRTGGNILDDSSSTFPILMGITHYDITVKSRYGDNYVFQNYDQVWIDTAQVTIRFYDKIGDPVPENTPVNINILFPAVWGYCSGQEILFQDTIPASPGFREERRYFFKTDSSGEIHFQYIPSNTGYANSIRDGSPSPRHHWYEQNKSYYGTKDEAFQVWKAKRTVYLDVRSAYLDGNGTWIKGAPLNKQNGELPVLVGPSLISLQTTGKNYGDQYLFTNESYVERADVSILLMDDLERPVPGGTQVLLENAVVTADAASGQCYPFIAGRLFSKNKYPVTYLPNDCGEGRYWAMVRTDSNGWINLQVEPPYASLRSEKPHWGNYNDPYLYPMLYSLDGEYNYLTLTTNSTLPVLTSAYHVVEAQFDPGFLGAGKIFSRAKIRITDTQGRPVPSGSTLIFTVDRGTIFGTTSSSVSTYISRDGKITVPYLSPTRSLSSQMTATLSINKTVRDPWGLGLLSPLATTTLTMEGIAYSPADPSLGKLLFGKSFSDILAELNPLKALGSMKNMADKAHAARDARIQLFQLLSSSDATDAEIQAANQEFRQRFSDLANSIATFIQDVPGTSFDPNFPLTSQGVVEDLLQKGIRRYYQDQLMNKLKSELESHVTDFITQKASGLVLKHITFAKIAQTFNFPSPAFQVTLTTPLHFVSSQTGMFEVYAFKFKISASDTFPVSFSVGDQFPLPSYLFPQEMTHSISVSQPVLSPGIMEVAAIPDSKTIEFVAMGILIPFQFLSPELIVSKVITDTSISTVNWLDGNGCTFPADAVNFDPTMTDSADVFIFNFPPPFPVRESDSLVIHASYIIGHISLPDSTIQPLAFQTPVRFDVNLSALEIDSSFLPTTFKPYRYDETNRTWIELPTLSGTDTLTLAFEIAQTGIYGIGGITSSVPVTDIRDEKPDTKPETFSLSSAYPNPFNGRVTLHYNLPDAQKVKIEIFDIQGRKITTIIDKQQPAGGYRVQWDGTNGDGVPVSSGIYFLRLQIANQQYVRKIIYVR